MCMSPGWDFYFIFTWEVFTLQSIWGHPERSRFFSWEANDLLPETWSVKVGEIACSFRNCLCEKLHKLKKTYGGWGWNWWPTHPIWCFNLNILKFQMKNECLRSLRRKSARSQREELRPWQRSWGTRLGIRKGVIKPQETPCSRASNPKTRVCFMFSPTPLTLRGALPHNRFSWRRSKRAAPRQ